MQCSKLASSGTGSRRPYGLFLPTADGRVHNKNYSLLRAARHWRRNARPTWNNTRRPNRGGERCLLKTASLNITRASTRAAHNLHPLSYFFPFYTASIWGVRACLLLGRNWSGCSVSCGHPWSFDLEVTNLASLHVYLVDLHPRNGWTQDGRVLNSFAPRLLSSGQRWHRQATVKVSNSPLRQRWDSLPSLSVLVAYLAVFGWRRGPVNGMVLLCNLVLG